MKMKTIKNKGKLEKQHEIGNKNEQKKLREAA
jgi:hypothetical protein